jgi:hypothetical protein
MRLTEFNQKLQNPTDDERFDRIEACLDEMIKIFENVPIAKELLNKEHIDVKNTTVRT